MGILKFNMKPYPQDTIAAIATPIGEGGIGIIRISGPDSLKILQKLLKITKRPTSHRVYYSKMFHVKHFWDKAPRSYTGEDVAEVHCHGGVGVLRAILSQIVGLGARLAERGEFTKRAFLNGKIDLAQAEAVLGLIKGKSGIFVEQSTRQLKGHLSEKINALYDRAIALIAAIEASIDFSDEIGSVSPRRLEKEILGILKIIDSYLATAEAGKILREGVRTAIIGAPNVGKSTLLNVLLGEERAIVTKHPGTTRDTLEEQLSIGDVVLKITDTAGIREAVCEIEKAGIERAKSEIDRADLILFVLDASSKISRQEKVLLGKLKGRAVIIVANKIDLGVRGLAGKEIGRVVKVSLINGKGVGGLKRVILKVVLGKGIANDADVILLTARHKECLLRAKESLSRGLQSIKIKQPVDLLTIDLRDAAAALGEVTGKAVTEQVLDKVFGEFCVGK